MSQTTPCAEIERLLFERRRGDLSDIQRAELVAHLDGCPGCREMARKLDDMLDAASASIDAASPQRWAEIDAEALFDRVTSQITAGHAEAEATDEATEVLDALLTAARDADRQAWSSFDADDLFGRIAAGIDASQTEVVALRPQPAAEAAHARPQPDVEALVDAAGLRPARWPYAAAAVALVALGVWWSAPGTDRAPASPAEDARVAADVDHVAAPDETGDEVVEPAASPGVAPEVSLAALAPVEAPGDALRLFAGGQTDLTVDASAAQTTVRLERGVVLAEWMPDAAGELTVVAGEHRVRVVGTVFYVSRYGAAVEVGVLEGQVRVQRGSEEATTVGAGQRLSGGELVALGDDERRQAEGHVDLVAHRQAVAQATQPAEATEPAPAAQAAAPEPEPRPEKRAPKLQPVASEPPDEPAAPGGEQAAAAEPAEATPPAEPQAEQPAVPVESASERTMRRARIKKLRRSAIVAQHHGAHRRATDLLRLALDATRPDEHDRADILLELARIHLRELDEPERAADYVRAVLQRWPDDRAAGALRHQLCEMTTLSAFDASLCP